MSDENEHDADELTSSLSHLEPGGDENPLEKPPLQYNPLNHAYPMIANTPLGIIEVMVQFALVKGKRGLPESMQPMAKELQVPAVIEDVPVTAPQPKGQNFFGSEFNGWARDAVSESALISELRGDEAFFLIPTIVRARRMLGGEGDAWELLTEDEVATIITAQVLFDLIIGYADKVANDPKAPVGLLDMLDHFTGRASRNQTKYPGVGDEEWNDEESADWN